MELLHILWVVIFLFFSLILLFVWSKMSLIEKKVKNISTLIEKCEQVIEVNTENEEKNS